SAIETSLLARFDEVKTSRERIQLVHREELLPLVDLGSLLGLRQAERPHEGQPLLVLQSQGKRVALAVDEVVGDLELAIRPLPPEVRRLAAYQGAATLARGELPVVLVSAHDSASDRQLGSEAGADAFLSKKECVSGRLVAEVSAVVARRQGAA